MFDCLADGRADLALYADAALPLDVHALDLFRETYSCLIRRGHPALLEGRKSERNLLVKLASYPRAVMLFPEGPRLIADDVLSRLVGAKRPAALTIPYFFSAPAALVESDLFSVPADAGGGPDGEHARSVRLSAKDQTELPLPTALARAGSP